MLDSPVQDGGEDTVQNSKKPISLQDALLNHLRKNRLPITVFLVNGIKLLGTVRSFDNFSVLLRRDTQLQLVYKHAIATIVPQDPISTEFFTLGALLGQEEPSDKEIEE